MKIDPVDWSKLSDDLYVATLSPSELWAIVQRWRQECDDRLGTEGKPEMSDEEFTTMTDTVMMIAESRGMDSNQLVPLYTAVALRKTATLALEEWDQAVLFAQRMEMRLRWESVADSEKEDEWYEAMQLNQMESDILEALGTDQLKGEALSRKAGYEYNSVFKQALAALVRHLILKNARGTGSEAGYYVSSRYRAVEQTSRKRSSGAPGSE